MYRSVRRVFKAGGFLPWRGNIEGSAGEGNGLCKRNSLILDECRVAGLGTCRYLGGSFLLANNILLDGM